MAKQSIKEFFTPQLKFWILGFISSVILFIILGSTGFESVNQFFINLLFLKFIFDEIIHVPAAGLFSAIWFIFLLYSLSCLFANIYKRISGKRDGGGNINFKRKLARNILAMILLSFGIFLISLTFVSCCPRARDARIMSALNQAKTVIAATVANGDYKNFTCDSGVMFRLCEEIDKNFGEQDKKEPVIALNSKINPNGICIYSPLNPPRINGWADWLKKSFSKITKIWYCVDSLGNSGKTNINPASSGYCVDGVSAVCPPIIGDNY